MAKYCKILSNPAKNYVTTSSRYANSKIMQYSENNLLTFETYKHKRGFSSDSDQWMEITAAYEYRPDLVSLEIYGAPDFWWRLLEANNMKDIMEFKRGVNIKLPGNVF